MSTREKRKEAPGSKVPREKNKRKFDGSSDLMKLFCLDLALFWYS